MKLPAYLLVRLLVSLFALLPFPLLYFLSDGLCWLLAHVFKYRRQVILHNLRIAFPGMSRDRQRALLKGFYLNFSDMLLESIKGLSMDEKTLRDRYRYTNPEILDQAAAARGGVVLLGSHLTNWEWGVLSVSLWLEAPVVGIFKPLSNPHLNEFLNRRRQRFGLNLRSMRQAGRAILEYREQPAVFVLIADQSTSDTRNAHWLPFFGRETAFLHGPAKIAGKTNYPVYQFDIRRTARGYYEVTFESIAQHPGELGETAVTQRFARRLEKRIREQPSDWLWSHRRWRWTRKV